MGKINIGKLEKATNLILLATALMGLYVFYPKVATFFIGSERMNFYQLLWNVCVTFMVFNVYLLGWVLVFRLKKKLDKWFEK